MSRAPTYADVKPVRELVTEEEAGECLAELDRTVHFFADLQYEKKVSDLALKRVFARLWHEARGNSKEREMAVHNSIHFELASVQALRAERALADLKSQMEIWEMKVQLWRTISANRRERDKLEFGNNGTRRNAEQDDGDRGPY